MLNDENHLSKAEELLGFSLSDDESDLIYMNR